MGMDMLILGGLMFLITGIVLTLIDNKDTHNPKKSHKQS